MATGLAPAELGGVIDPVDVAGLGSQEWGRITGIDVTSPLISGGPGGYNIEQGPWSRVITQPYSQAGPAADVLSTPEGMPSTSVSHWRDVFNFRGSWVPWVLVALVLIVMFSHFRLRAGAGGAGFGRSFRAGAELK